MTAEVAVDVLTATDVTDITDIFIPPYVCVRAHGVNRKNGHIGHIGHMRGGNPA